MTRKRDGQKTIEEQHAEDRRLVFTDCDERTAYTTYHHKACGKFWTEKPDDELPNYCPGCGMVIFNG